MLIWPLLLSAIVDDPLLVRRRQSPKLAPQPLPEDALLTGPLKPTNEWYAIAKITGLELAQACRREYGCDFISAMPTDLYGAGDNFDLAVSAAIGFGLSS